ncbi:entericidin A/B family lipoprotein [Glaesserella sp.]
MKKLVLIVLTSLTMLTACNTVSGFGKDVEKAGGKLQESAEKYSN